MCASQSYFYGAVEGFYTVKLLDFLASKSLVWLPLSSAPVAEDLQDAACYN